ncbi:MAG: hypothetical protein KDB32_10575 [Planctomycetes bacterium]|nr:hypothetical protein [Planctomycetota bacterium]
MSTQRIQKNLTVMFTDISGFTKHTETISRDALMSRLDTHNELLMPIIAHFEGKIVKSIGDAFLITFESPTNAVQCGLFMQHTLRKYNVEKPEPEQIHIKVSINSGEVTVTDNDVFGDPVNVAAKIEKATNPDEIYFTESVFLAMVKAEVPTSFVKAFRPKGTESTEIKLYKVAMDEADARYQKVISGTHIDKEKMKTRVLELSNMAEKEFVRYQDTLDALVEGQSSSSRTMVFAVLVAAVILAVALIVGLSIYSGGSKDAPNEQLAKDVRAYLTSDKPAEARGRVESYINEFGADDATGQLLTEIQEYEVRVIVAKADRLIEQGLPEDARSAIKEYFGARELTDTAKQGLARADAYISARQLVEDGKAEDAITTIKRAFGDTNPSPEIKLLRDRANALIDAEKLMQSSDRYKEPLKLLGVVSGAFGDDTRNKAALAYIEEAIANELYRSAKANGYETANTDYENYRKRFPNMLSWGWVEAQLSMGGMWEVRTGNGGNRYWDSSLYRSCNENVVLYVSDKPEKKYRFGCFLFFVSRWRNLAIADGSTEWLEALKIDPSLKERHRELMMCYAMPMSGEKAELCKDLKTDVAYMLGCFTNDILAMRELIKKYFYAELLDTMVSFVNSTDEKLETEQMNSLAILAEKGDVQLITDRFAVFRAQFDSFLTSTDSLTRYHSNTLFQAEMTYDDYKEYRNLIDTTLDDVTNKRGRYGSYTRVPGVLQAMLTDIRAAQPIHTAQYDG